MGRGVTAVKLDVDFYREGDKFIAYCSALDISTCGDTFEKAQRKFEEMIDIFLEETIKMGTLEEVLTECGWKKISRPHLHWKPPVRRFITQLEEEVNIPCPA